jgi:hypothetical protein
MATDVRGSLALARSKPVLLGGGVGHLRVAPFSIDTPAARIPPSAGTRA